MFVKQANEEIFQDLYQNFFIIRWLGKFICKSITSKIFESTRQRHHTGASTRINQLLKSKLKILYQMSSHDMDIAGKIRMKRP